MWRKFCGFLLKIWGWTPVGGTAPDDKCILLGAPHTSIWDFVVAYLFYKSVGGDALCMVKEEFFKWPVLGWLIRKMGGIPVNRKNPSAIVLSVIREMETNSILPSPLKGQESRSGDGRQASMSSPRRQGYLYTSAISTGVKNG